MKTLDAIALSTRDRQAIERACQVIRQRVAAASIILFGSKARGEDSAESDIDLLIVSEGNKSEDLLLKRLSSVERKIQREINYKFYLANEFRKQLRSHDPFLEEVLGDKYILLKGTV